MTEYEFTCSECKQVIEVNDKMREAIVANGCPVCASAASEEEFA